MKLDDVWIPIILIASLVVLLVTIFPPNEVAAPERVAYIEGHLNEVYGHNGSDSIDARIAHLENVIFGSGVDSLPTRKQRLARLEGAIQ